ncbi:hypothetical protein [Qipengyuania sediminis]|uniref:hypothetical protein n=1 Tax=Qipengyuania sediminis TaxID=1532023 RepID=UPI00105A7D12|nr:hypothetical protein [Qipengyuania sediminis]
MRRDIGKVGGLRVVPALLAAAGLVALAPVAGAAAVGSLAPAVQDGLAPGHIVFTPANVDPALARRVAATLGLQSLRFTPAARPPRGDRVVTMAVRVDHATARAITVRRTLAEGSLGTRAAALDLPLAIAPTRYNLGTARGFTSFAAAPLPRALAMPGGIRDAGLPDIAAFRIDAGKPGKPSRFQPRIAFEDANDLGRAPRTLDGAGEQSVQLGGAYRVLKNLDVTAGVRVSQDRNRIAPLTDGVADDQAVYVGTQLRF